MRILFVTHLFPPLKNCGSETYAVALLTHLIKEGHHCTVMLMPFRGQVPAMNYFYKSIEVFPFHNNLEARVNWSDIIITHLAFTESTMALAMIYRRPCYHICHSDTDKPKDRILEGKTPVRIIYNSHVAAKAMNYPHPAIVLHPPITPENYDTHKSPFKNPYITLINLNEIKGSPIFYEIAKRMPERKFLAVKGSYGDQILSDLPNVITLENSPDILPVYAQTRILLMPSQRESFGMTAREAMCSGIPVICSDMPGLRENCGEAATYLDPADIDQWVSEIKKLDSKKLYLSISEKCKHRAYYSDIPEQLKALDAFLNVGR